MGRNDRGEGHPLKGAASLGYPSRLDRGLREIEYPTSHISSILGNPKINLYFLPILSGALLTLCFPKPDLGWLAWVALVPFLSSSLTVRQNDIGGFKKGYLFGISFFLTLLYWIYPTCRAGGVQLPVAMLATVGLSAILATVPSLFAAGLSYFTRKSYKKRLFYILFPIFASCLWVALELFRERFLGFPWEPLGNTQWRLPILLQITAWAGVHGLSFLVVWVNASIALSLTLSSVSLKSVARILALPVLALALTMGYGFMVLRTPDKPTGTIAVAVLQGNIDQYKKWDASFDADIRDTYAQLATKDDSLPGGIGIDLMVWPESALPGWWEEPDIREWTDRVVRASSSYHLIGAVSRGTKGEAENAALLVGPDGRLIRRYAKRHLVPFGERIPLQSILGRWVEVLNELGGIEAGTDPSPLPHPKARLGTGICYESIFPNEVRVPVKAGADVLINLTNDGWYLDTAGPYQHLSMNALRAAENRRPLVRSANTGISAFFDSRGRMIGSLPLGSRGILRGMVQVDSSAPLTFFTRFGEVFAWLCVLASAALLAWGYLAGRRPVA